MIEIADKKFNQDVMSIDKPAALHCRCQFFGGAESPCMNSNWGMNHFDVLALIPQQDPHTGVAMGANPSWSSVSSVNGCIYTITIFDRYDVKQAVSHACEKARSSLL